jgi:hypothetical protein
MSDDEKLATDLRVTADHLNLLMRDAAEAGLLVEPLITYRHDDGKPDAYSINLRISRPL